MDRINTIETYCIQSKCSNFMETTEDKTSREHIWLLKLYCYKGNFDIIWDAKMMKSGLKQHTVYVLLHCYQFTKKTILSSMGVKVF